MAAHPAKTAPAAPARTRDPEATRARILAAAERLFAEHGYNDVTMPMIASASGITPGAIYKHFDGKAALFFHVLRQVAEASVAPPGGAPGSPAKWIPLLVGGYAGLKRRRLRKLGVEVHYAAGRRPEVRRMLRRSLDRQLSDLAEVIAGAQAKGELQANGDAERLAQLVFVLIMGLMNLETLAPHLVGDPAWIAFVEARVAAMIGAKA
jgi:AcrR family transcriptional regulator